MKMTHIQNRAKPRGFTLIEMLLYVAIASIVIGAISTLLYISLQARVKNQTIAEVEQQGTAAMRIMTQSIRNAESIISPASGTENSITLDVVDSVADPTSITLTDGTLYFTEGGAAPIALTNDRVQVSDFTATNVSGGTGGAIRVSFTASHINVSGRQEYSFSQEYYATATLR